MEAVVSEDQSLYGGSSHILDQGCIKQGSFKMEPTEAEYQS